MPYFFCTLFPRFRVYFSILFQYYDYLKPFLKGTLRMSVNERRDLFETMPVPRAVATMSIPAVITSLITVVYNLADTYFVSMLNDPIQNAAVTLAFPLLLAFNAVNNLFGVGSSSMMSRALGQQDFDTVHKSSAFGFYCSLICGILFSLLYGVFSSPILSLLGADQVTRSQTGQYLFWTVTLGAAPSILNVVMGYMVRAEGAALHAGIGTISGCILNIILDPFFILPWGLNMGAAGAGLATFVSNVFACLYFLVLLYVKRRSTHVCIKPSFFKLNRKVVKGVCGVGIPASIQNLLNVTGTLVLNNFAAGYGAAVVAAIGIAGKITSVPFYTVLGVSQGIMPLISYNYASGNAKRMKSVFLFTTAVTITTMTVLSSLLFIFSRPLVGWFMADADVITHGSIYLRILSVAYLLLSIDFMAVGVFQACGMGKKALLFAILRKVVLEIPLLFLLNRLIPVYGIACAQPIAEFVLSIAAALTLVRIFSQADRRQQQIS